MIWFITKHNDEICLAVAEDLKPGTKIEFISIKEILKKINDLN